MNRNPKSSSPAAFLLPWLCCIWITSSWALDSNNNSFDDIWESYYSASALSPSDDADGDGSSNLEEAQAGTDPFDDQDWPEISQFTHDGSTAKLSIRTKLGKRYVIWRATDLSENNSDWQIDNTLADVLGTGTVVEVTVTAVDKPKEFFRISVVDLDSDDDGLSDWGERLLSAYDHLSDFSDGGTVSDRDRFLADFQAASGSASVQLSVTDSEAYEVFGENGLADNGSYTLTRSGGLDPITIFLTTTGDATDSDYTLKDTSGTIINGFLTLGFGETSKTLLVEPVVTAKADYPISTQLAIQEHADYTIGAANGGAVTIYDANDIDAHSQLFYGPTSPERGASTTASGYATIRLNGRRDRALVDFNFNSLTSTQTAAHVHHAGDNGSGGATNGPVVESLPLGVIDDHVWQITATGPYSGQDLIDALYGQDGALPLYVNAHTTNAPGGEIWAFFAPYNAGAFEPPSAPVVIDPLTGDDLRKDISRFLTQASFGPDKSDIDSLYDSIVNTYSGDRIAAFDAWIDEQFSRPQSSMHSLTYAMDTEEYAMNGHSRLAGGNPQPFLANRRGAWWTQASAARDQLRQRVGFALSQILVISEADTTVRNRSYAAASYWDMLSAHSDGNFRDILVDVSKHPLMGKYLSHLQNAKAEYDNQGNQITSPDENYAREIMQLFSIGLVSLNPDGRLKFDNSGDPIPTYTNADITELAKVFTGWSFSKRTGSRADGFPVSNNTSFTYNGGSRYFETPWIEPMINFSAYHDTSAKTYLGQTSQAGLSGEQDLQAAIDVLFQHDNVGPFIGRLLIQRLVTSNPSSSYIYRVSQAFDGADGGTRGDMKAVVKAILLDREARDLNVAKGIGYGKQKEPVVRYVQLIRALNGKSQLPLADLQTHGLSADQLATYEPGATQYRFYDTSNRLGQSPHQAPSVFNWFLPDYKVAGPLATNGLVVPEFTITSETQVIDAVNFHHSIISSSSGLSVRRRYNVPSTNTDSRILLDISGIESRMTSLYQAASGSDSEKELSAITTLLDEYDLVMTGGLLKERYEALSTTNPRSAIIECLVNIWSPSNDDTSYSDRQRVARDLIHLISTSPEYLIQK